MYASRWAHHTHKQALFLVAALWFRAIVVVVAQFKVCSVVALG